MINAKTAAEWTDEEVLASTEEDLTQAQNDQLSALLQRQQAGKPSEGDKKALQTLMVLYQCKLLRKATALNEAVRRGLKEPLRP